LSFDPFCLPPLDVVPLNSLPGVASLRVIASADTADAFFSLVNRFSADLRFFSLVPLVPRPPRDSFCLGSAGFRRPLQLVLFCRFLPSACSSVHGHISVFCPFRSLRCAMPFDNLVPNRRICVLTELSCLLASRFFAGRRVPLPSFRFAPLLLFGFAHFDETEGLQKFDELD